MNSIYADALSLAQADRAAAEYRRVELIRAWKNAGEKGSLKAITKATDEERAFAAVVRSLTALAGL